MCRFGNRCVNVDEQWQQKIGWEFHWFEKPGLVYSN
jgi:hypothetical protein